MGRDTGWIALEAGIAGGADVILIPEIPFNMAAVVEHVEQRNQRGAKFSIIVVAEGAFPQGKTALYRQTRELGAVPRLGGIGETLRAELQTLTEASIRVTVLGHLQRGGSPTAFDRLLASRFGTMAVHLIAQGKLGYMVALQHGDIVSVPLAEAVGKQKVVPLDSDLITTALGLDICLGRRLEELEDLKSLNT